MWCVVAFLVLGVTFVHGSYLPTAPQILQQSASITQHAPEADAFIELLRWKKLHFAWQRFVAEFNQMERSFPAGKVSSTDQNIVDQKPVTQWTQTDDDDNITHDLEMTFPAAKLKTSPTMAQIHLDLRNSFASLDKLEKDFNDYEERAHEKEANETQDYRFNIDGNREGSHLEMLNSTSASTEMEKDAGCKCDKKSLTCSCCIHLTVDKLKLKDALGKWLFQNLLSKVSSYISVSQCINIS